MNFIQVSQLAYRKGTQQILQNFSCDIHANEFVGLIGPNGAGKTTALKLIAGILAPTQGEIVFPSLTSAGSSFVKQRAQFLGYLAQSEKPAWPLSVENLVALGRIPHAHYSPEKIEQALVATETETLRHKNLFELSGGELQRVMLARVFAGEPKVILADEPIAALDIYHQLHVMELLAGHAQQGGAVVAALHDLSLAARFCSRLILLDDGKIIADGQPATVLSDKNIEQVYRVKTHVQCNAESVSIIPHSRIEHTRAQS